MTETTKQSPLATSTRARGTAKSIAPTFLSRRQREVLDVCVDFGEIFYSQAANLAGPIRPRLYPLLCAPTGSGKSMLVATSAQRLGAFYKRTQRGDLAPQGAARMRSSLFQILDLLSQHERVLWHIDELDKFSVEGDGATPSASDWGASIFSDLWSALDGVFPIDTYLGLEDRPRAKDALVTAEFLRGRISTGLYVVGSGTWQKLFAQAARRSLGFSSHHDSAPAAVTPADVVKSQLISPELLGRFNSHLLILGYPDQAEITELIRVTGIAKLAKETRYQITAEDLDFNRGGFRVLEALLSRLLLLQHRRQRRADLAKAQMNISSGPETENLPFNE